MTNTKSLHNYKNLNSIDLGNKAKKIISWIQKQSPGTVINTEVPFTGFFHGGTEDWEIAAFSIGQLQTIIQRQCEAQQIAVDENKLLSYSEKFLRTEVRKIRDIIKENDNDEMKECTEYNEWMESFEITAETSDDELHELTYNEAQQIAKKMNIQVHENETHEKIIQIFRETRNKKQTEQKKTITSINLTTTDGEILNLNKKDALLLAKKEEIHKPEELQHSILLAKLLQQKKLLHEENKKKVEEENELHNTKKRKQVDQQRDKKISKKLIVETKVPKMSNSKHTNEFFSINPKTTDEDLKKWPTEALIQAIMSWSAHNREEISRSNLENSGVERLTALVTTIRDNLQKKDLQKKK